MTAVDAEWKSGGSSWKLQLKTRPADNLITASSKAFVTRFVPGCDQRVCLSTLRVSKLKLSLMEMCKLSNVFVFKAEKYKWFLLDLSSPEQCALHFMNPHYIFGILEEVQKSSLCSLAF
jgi:hypothetical protein